jgi:putative transposase
MPSKNRIKTYAPDTYYHIYNRGVNKQVIFREPADYNVFLNLLKRYLGEKPQLDKSGREYPWLKGELQLLAFCLMPNHYHLLIHQETTESMTKLIRGIGTSYTMYFNKKYKRTGPLFQERFKAVMISRDEYLLHISRYIHLNPDEYKQWEYSSLPYYLGKKHAAWITPELILNLFEASDYMQFLADYEDHRRMLKEIAYELADL